MPGLSYRSSIGAAAAAATERIINALLQQRIRASAVSAAELDAALEELSVGLADAPEPPAAEDDADADLDERVPALAGAVAGQRSQSRPGFRARTGCLRRWGGARSMRARGI